MHATSLPPSDTPAGPLLDPAAWRWLLDLRARLNVLVEILDDREQFLLPLLPGETSARLRAALGQIAPAALEATTRRVGGEEPPPLRAGGFTLVAFHLEADRALRLVVADPSDRDNGRAGRELAGIGEWLARSLASELAAQSGRGATVNGRDWEELAVLHRLLAQAASSGSAREVVRLFVEAMAIWSDADVRGYVGDLSERFVLDVALAQADVALSPATLPDAPGRAGAIERLSPEQASALGFGGRESVLLARVGTSRTAPWVLAYRGAPDRRAEVRLAAFVDVLGPRLDAAAEVEASRLLWAMMQRLMVPDVSAPTSGIAEALRELADVVPCQVALRVVGPSGRTLIDAGDLDLLSGVDPLNRGVRLVVDLRSAKALRASLVVHAPAGRALTLREQHLTEVAGSVVQTWLDGLVDKKLLPADRRREPDGTFERMLGRQLAALRGERPVSLVVVAPSTHIADPADLQTAVGDLRRHVRPFDAVGLLETGEIAIWLPGVSAEHAVLLRNRFRDLLCSPAAVAWLADARVGVSTGTAATGRPTEIIEAARAALGQKTPTDAS